MSINRISNPAKLRRIERLVGAPILRAYSRCFVNQNEVLAFSAPETAWVVRLKAGAVEHYDEGHYRLREREDGSFVLSR